MIGIEDRVTISPATWPERATVAPGDLASFAPIGLAMAAPAILTPWDSLESVVSRGSSYGALARTGHPFHDAPINESAGGIVYFDSHIPVPQLRAVTALLHVIVESKAYAVYAAESTDPKADRYLAQIRIVLSRGMHVFGVSAEASNLEEQKIGVGALIAAFINAQNERWPEGSLAGALGGDGDYADERIGFGFMVENAFNGIYRLWSRPWLVTK